MRWPLQPLQPFQQTQLQPPFGQSVDSLCHPWFTTTNVSYRFPILKLPPPPRAVLLVTIVNRVYKPCYNWGGPPCNATPGGREFSGLPKQPGDPYPRRPFFAEGHAAPGAYARAYLEGRLDLNHIMNFRQEAGKMKVHIWVSYIGNIYGQIWWKHVNTWRIGV